MNDQNDWLLYVMDRKRWPNTGTILVAPETAPDARPEEYMYHHSLSTSVIGTVLSPGETVDDLVAYAQRCRPGCKVLKLEPEEQT
jgi:hypothetical protein